MSTALIEFTDEQKKVIRSQFFPPNVSDNEMIYCMEVAKNLGLNPILKEIYFVERKSMVNGQWVTKVEPLAGKNAFLKLAHNSGHYAGMETTVELRDVPFFNNGAWEVKKDLVATAKVHRNDCEMPFIVEVAYNEYVQRKKDGSPTKFWAEKPQTMLKKVAASQALREAFSVSGIYDESELEEADEELKPYKNETLASMPKPRPKRRTKAQQEAERKVEEVTEAVIEEEIPI